MGLQIKLENPNRSYYAGQSFDGQVVLQNTKPIDVKEIVIFLEGQGQLRSKYQKPSKNKTAKAVEYITEESYISDGHRFFGNGVTTITLPKGTNAYPFHINLPANLPSSFTSDVGQVRYFVYVEIRRLSFKKNDKIELTWGGKVNGILDLNLEPKAALPQECRQVKVLFNMCSCMNGQVECDLKLPNKSGFVPGDILDFRVDILNGSSRKVEWVKASLQRVVKFKTKNSAKTFHKIVSELVEDGDRELWMPKNFKVPSNPDVPPTRLGANNCKMIDLQYFLLFEMKISGVSGPLSGKLSVIIGTVPLGHTLAKDIRPASGMPMPIMLMPTPQLDVSLPYPEIGFRLPSPQIRPISSTFIKEGLPPYLNLSENFSHGRSPSASTLQVYPLDKQR